MGCCSSRYEIFLMKPEALFNDIINKTIKYRFQNYGIENISNFDKNNINKVIIQIGSIQTNALGLSILLGDARLMKYLHESLQADFTALEEQLQIQNLTLIEFLILNFNAEILRYYMPVFIKKEEDSLFMQLDDTLQFVSLNLPVPKKKVHPMRYAAEIGNIPFLSFVLNYFKNDTAPESFNIHSVDEFTGENCALIACAQSNLELIAFLYRQNCDFTIKNMKNETAINLALVNYEQEDYKSLDIIKFLVETVGLDITENFEESLMLCSYRSVSLYIEEHLKLNGISTTKRIVESKFETSFVMGKVIQDSEYNITSLPSLISSIDACDLSSEPN